MPTGGNNQMPRRAAAFFDFAALMEQDIEPFIEAHYPTLPGAANRAIAGLSMGGAQALRVGLNHPQRFAWVGGFSAGWRPSTPSSAIGDEFPLLEREKAGANAQFKLIYLACGEQDFLIEPNRVFNRWLQSKGVAHQYHETPGIHDWIFWHRALPEFAAQLFR